MKKITLLSAGIVLVNSSFAQTLQDAITKTDNERYAAAAVDFRSLIAKEANKGENYFYFGENFFKDGNLDSANFYYQKGAEVNATYPLNHVGLGKVLWSKGKSQDAQTAFFKAATLGANKNTEVMRKTAEIYITSDNKNIDGAINLLNAAIKIEPKNPDNYILMGDALLEKNPTDGGPAIKQYSKATELNPKSPKGVLRSGKLYQRGRNYQLALDLYKQAETIDPNYAPAYREKAELYHMAGQDGKAIESYKKYLELNNSDEARERYASFLFTNKQYADAITEIEALQKDGNTNMYLDRILGYSYAELGNKTDKDAYTKGLISINKFFEKAGSTFKYAATDYKYKGILLAKTGQDSVGVTNIEKAIEMDPKLEKELVSLIATTWMGAKKYTKVITTYERKMAGDPKNLTIQDWYDFGRAYYYEGGVKQREKKDVEATELFVKSDTCFSQLCQLKTDYPMGYFWRGRINTQLDPKDEKYLAKPHYEKALGLVKPEEKMTYKSNIIEANLYLGSHYAFSKEKDLTKAKEYFKIVLELDPTNKAANDFFKSPAGK
jgi:tetratricopeptide (TPR) repeat protein